MILDREDWFRGAACRGKSPSIFFPLPIAARGVPGRDSYAYARSLCAGCPVLADCRQYALDIVRSGQRLDGMWGGMDEDERQVAVHGHKRARPAAWAS